MTSGIKHRLISPGIIAVIAALLLAGGVLFANHLLESPLQRSVNFEIERGSALNTVLHRLTSDDITPVPNFVLKLYAFITLSEGTVKAGEYALSESLD